jgi:hypothetical protein
MRSRKSNEIVFLGMQQTYHKAQQMGMLLFKML